MIDEKMAKEHVEKMNKQKFQNLLTALAVEKYLFDIFGNALGTSYSPDTGTLIVRFKDTRSNALKNIIESVKMATHKKADKARYFGIKGKTTSGARLEFGSGFSVMAILEATCL